MDEVVEATSKMEPGFNARTKQDPRYSSIKLGNPDMESQVHGASHSKQGAFCSSFDMEDTPSRQIDHHAQNNNRVHTAYSLFLQCETDHFEATLRKMS